MRARALAVVQSLCRCRRRCAASMSAQQARSEAGRQAAAKSTDGREKKPLKSKTVSPKSASTRCRAPSVWIAPPPIARAELGADPKQPKEITCTFEITQLGGTAPKFDCKSENGERLRIKYGSSPEVPSEVASAKLLHALGFGADNVDARRKGALLRLPGRAVHDHEDARLRRRAEALREGDGPEGLQGLRVGGGRAQALRPRRSRPRRSKAGRSSSSI